MVSLDAPLDRGDPQAGAFLDGLQGNILKAHARDHAVHFVIRFGADQAASRCARHCRRAQGQRSASAGFRKKIMLQEQATAW